MAQQTHQQGHNQKSVRNSMCTHSTEMMSSMMQSSTHASFDDTQSSQETADEPIDPARELFDFDISQVVRTKPHTKAKLACVLAVFCACIFAFIFFRTHTTTKAPKGSFENPVVVGVVGAGDPQWKAFVEEAQKAGIYVELKNFTDYTSENPALAQGSLDLNEFQHILYLANYNVKNNQDLTPISGVAIYPLGLFSSAYKSPEDIPHGSTITIPNDETNQARALGVLASAKLIELEGGWTPFVTPRNINERTSRVKVQPVEAAKVANSLSDPSIAGAVINNDYMKDAGLKAEDAIFKDDATLETAQPYVNVWVSRKADADNPTYKKLMDIWHSDAVTSALVEKLQNTAVINNDSAEKLAQVLTTTQDALRASLKD